MSKLQVLPPNIANMIAAGEVVQRPSSVVKELVENAVDAGATDIKVVITDAGRTLIQVIDNGCGMSASDAILCFERHATSKISSQEDLEAIMTYGFRGEALASIAAVADITLRTRRASDETGTQVNLSAFGKMTTEPVSAPVGSNFAIRNLFYNTPARRKFLKSDNIEFKHIVEEFTRIALTKPELAFTLIHNGKEVHVLRKAKSLKFRILDILGANVVGDVVDLIHETSMVRVSGFLGRPDAARKTLGNQFFFVNGRFFRSNYLHKAVMKAYEELIPEGLTPSYFIFLDMDPHSMDVNVHPTKTEIKFEDESVLFQVLYACVRSTLGQNSFGASIDFDTEGAVQMPQLSHSFDEYKGGLDLSAQIPSAEVDPNYNPFDDAPIQAYPDASSHSSTPDYSRFVSHHENYSPLFEQKAEKPSQIMTVLGRYIIVPASSGIMAVNIRRAMERILFERALAALSGNGHVTQSALFPVQVQVGVEQRLLFDEYAPMLTDLGFDISSFGTDTVVVNGVPEGYSCEEGKVCQMVQDLILILSDDYSALPEIMRSSMAERFATLGSFNCEAPGTALEAQQLLDALFACSNSEFTSNGKRIASIITTEELDKRF